MVFESEVSNGILRMDCLGSIFGFSVEDSDVVMARVIDKLIEEKKIIGIVLAESREHEYDFEQTKMLKEIATAIVEIVREKRIVSIKNMGDPRKCQKYAPKWYSWLHDLVTYQLRGDPIGAYIKLVRELRHIKTKLSNETGTFRDCLEDYALKALLPIKDILENIKLIQLAKPHISGYHVGNRDLYRMIFNPTVRPNFMFTKYMIEPPTGETVARYKVGDIDVEIFKLANKTRHIYHVIPPEFKLSENEYTLLDAARRVLEERRPHELEMRDQERMRDLFYTLGLELIRDLADEYKMRVTAKQIDTLAKILTRYTAGLGVIEILLEDPKIQDIYINSPLGNIPIYIFHGDFEECETNLLPTPTDGDRWATRFKLISGRPLDEANPVLDTEIVVPGGRARVAAINPKLSPDGLAFALRKHRLKPWTFPLFIDNKFFNPLYAGLMSFIIDNSRTFLVAGTRASGKTSLLGSMMLQIMPHYRIITVEDTIELPVEQLRELGYNIERMKSRSVITRVETELPADEALRTALRLGDSSLIIGEVRSVEAKALYEAMRIGALANVVAGTIHGESAYGVFDRVVNDLGVPPTSFKATDIITICSRLRTPDGLHSFRRVTGLTEVRKHWRDDPMEEGGFVNLMEYSSKEDQLKPTDTLLNGESYVLNEIASRVRDWSGNWAAVWDNINLRSKILKTMVDLSKGNKDILEAETLLKSNQMFHIISDLIRKEVGTIESKRVYEDWLNWFKKEIKSE